MKKEMRWVWIGVASVIIGAAWGWLPLFAFLATAGGCALGAQGIEMMRKKDSENHTLLKECRESLGAVKRLHKKIGALLEKIKAENRLGIWSNLNTRFMYIEPYFLEHMLKEVTALMDTPLLYTGKAHRTLIALKKEISDHLVTYEEIERLAEKMEALKKQTSELILAITEEIKVVGRTKELAPDAKKEFLAAIKRFKELRGVGTPRAVQQIDRAAICGELAGILNAFKRIGEEASYTLPKKIGRDGNIVPFKKTS